MYNYYKKYSKKDIKMADLKMEESECCCGCGGVKNQEIESESSKEDDTSCCN